MKCIPELGQVQKKLTAEDRYFPLATRLEADHHFWLQAMAPKGRPYQVLLESGRAGRYHILACEPACRLYGKDEQLMIEDLDTQGRVKHRTVLHGPLLPRLRQWMAGRKAPSFSDLPDFCGGLLGFFSYDLVRQFEQLPAASLDDTDVPDVYLLAFEQVIVYDRLKRQLWLIRMVDVDVHHVHTERLTDADIARAYAEGQRQLASWRTDLEQKHMPSLASFATWMEPGRAGWGADPLLLNAQGPPVDAAANPWLKLTDMKHSFARKAFVRAVQRIQDYIAAGDVFQVNLSVRQSVPMQADPFAVYQHLRIINPSPYMGYLHFPDMQVICGSPEQLIKRQGSRLNTRPIAGTRPRGTNREQDLQLARELIGHEKERAEHVMLVDLERNDLGKVCRYGTVKVDEFMAIEQYSHVMHIVSNVVGELDQYRDAFDVIQAVFPGGTITGAPKVRTMEIIEELEPVRRGLYTGSIGWIDFNGDMELNIVIRTMLVKDGWAHVQAGAGIVMDSAPEKEYVESLNKAKAMWSAYAKSSKIAEQSVIRKG